MNGRVGFIMVALLWTGVSSAAGQRIDTPYRFFEETQAAGLWAGYISTDKGTIGLGPESGPAFGGRFHIRLGGPFFLEAEGLYFQTRRAVLDTVVVDSAFQQAGEADIGIALIQASLRFNVTGQRTWNSLLPFIVLGVGVGIQAQDDDEADAAVASEARYDFGTSFAGQVGAGIEWFPAQRLAIRVDARNLLWQLKAPEGLLLRNLGRPLPQDEWVNNLTASVGISLHF
jgi:hypothetical protein